MRAGLGARTAPGRCATSGGGVWRQSEERTPLWAAWKVREVARSGVDVLVVIGGARVRARAFSW